MNIFDRGSILVIVYSAFSQGSAAGVWHLVSGAMLFAVLVLNFIMLAALILVTTFGSRWLGFSTEEEIAIVFCGSKKSMASGLPMANILFPGHAVGLIVLPLMIFHQIQLFVCATLAKRYAARTQGSATTPRNILVTDPALGAPSAGAHSCAKMIPRSRPISSRSTLDLSTPSPHGRQLPISIPKY
jgi:sodium/bile acid cotransporter 7